MNDPQLKGPYGMFVNAHTVFILGAAKYSALNLKYGPRGMLHRILHTFLKHFVSLRIKNYEFEGKEQKAGREKTNFICFERQNIKLLKCAVLTPSYFQIE